MRNSLTTAAISIISAALAGVALGFVTQILQGSLAGSSSVLANSGAMWILVAFALGLVMPSSRTAAIGGAVALVAASISYYVAVDWFEGTSSTPRSAVVWSIAGIVAGSTFGFAGFLARHDQRRRRSAWALLAGVLVGEGIHLTWYVGNAQLRPAGIAELAVAAIVTIVILRRARSAGLVAAIIVAAALATLLATSLINEAFTAL
jgi:Family of unknown function (DUF6518)